jgi:hypothetical protein
MLFLLLTQLLTNLFLTINWNSMQPEATAKLLLNTVFPEFTKKNQSALTSLPNNSRRLLQHIIPLIFSIPDIIVFLEDLKILQTTEYSHTALDRHLKFICQAPIQHLAAFLYGNQDSISKFIRRLLRKQTQLIK